MPERQHSAKARRLRAARSCYGHLAEPLAARLFARPLEPGWVQRGRESRAILVTPSGHLGLQQVFGLVLQSGLAA
jgi:hypothetical protein